MKRKSESLNLKAIFLFSIPSIVSIILEPLAGIVDTALVGGLSTVWLASLGISVTILSSFTWVFNFLIHTSAQKVAYFSGKNDRENVYLSIKISLGLAIVVGVMASSLLYFLRETIYLAFKVGPSVYISLEEYFVPRSIWHFQLIFFTTLISIYRGLSKVKEAMYIVLISVMANIFLSWLFLYPLNMGIKGAAYGTVISNSVGVALCIVGLFMSDLKVSELIKVKTTKSLWLSFGKNSFSLFFRSLSLTACFFLATRLSSYLGVVTLASHQILLQVWLFPSFFIDGVAVTATVLIPRYVAVRDRNSIVKIARNTLLVGLIIGFMFSILYFFFSTQIQNIFINDPKVLEVLKQVWIIMVVAQIVSSCAYVFDGILFGLEEFSKLAIMMIIGVVFIYLPCLYFAYDKENFRFVWIGLSLLAFFRLVTGYNIIKTRIGSYL